ncbi:hypothetical protein WUBG_13271, partial [Wuchereria bancrofti]
RPTNTLKSSLKNGCYAAIAAEKLEVLVRCWLFLDRRRNCCRPRFLDKFTVSCVGSWRIGVKVHL